MKASLEVKRFVFNPFLENTYVVGDGEGNCVVIDPGCHEKAEEEELAAFLQERGWQPVAVLLTHGHLDHVCGTAFLAREYGLTPLLHPADMELYRTVPQQAELFSFPVGALPAAEPLPEEEIPFGNTSLRILHLPGHSPGSVAFYHPETKILFPGDVIFNGSIGRTDLPGGDYDRLRESIARGLVATLPPDTRIFPGHGPDTTLEREVRENPFLDFLER